MIPGLFQSERSSLESQAAALQAQISATQQRITALGECEAQADGAIQALTNAVEKVSALAPSAITTFKTAVDALFSTVDNQGNQGDSSSDNSRLWLRLGLTESLTKTQIVSLRIYDEQLIGLVYKITCVRNMDCYIGSTSGYWTDFVEGVRRFREHRNQLIKGNHSSKKFQRDWKEYGESAFGAEIVEVVPLERFRFSDYKPGCKIPLLEREKHWQELFNAVYSQSRKNGHK